MELSIAVAAMIALAIAAVVHAFIRKQELASILGALLCALANLLWLELETGFAIKPGWLLPVFMIGFGFGLIICFGVGLLFQPFRKSR